MLLLLHSYLLYPISLYLIGLAIKKQAVTSTPRPIKASVIISAYNEEKVIKATIDALISSFDKNQEIEILVGSDNSTDATNEIVSRISESDSRVRLYEFAERRGKSHVLSDLAKHASGEILIFADANTIYHKGSIEKLLKYYDDPAVGGVSGRLILRQISAARESGSYEKTYWDLETRLKHLEGELGFLIGSNGGIYSIRKELFPEFPADTPTMDDFYITMKVLEKKKKFVFETEATAEENVAPSVEVEFRRKIRNNALMLFSIGQLKKLLSPRYGLVAYGFWSHKIIRWFTPVLLLITLISSLMLSQEGGIYYYLLRAQVLFYFLGLLGIILKSAGLRISVLMMVYYFIVTNIAMLIGILNFLSGKQKSTWQSTARQ